MPLKLASPVETSFVLKQTDILFKNEGEPTTVIIRQATQRQHELRASQYANLVQEQSREDPDSVRYITRFSQAELMRIETQLTMVGCNIQKEDGSPLFSFRSDANGRVIPMGKEEFDKAWGLLPMEVCEEIHKCVREVNLMWAPQGEE